MQRIGVFVCHCGSNIAATVDVKQLVAYVKSEPGVVYANDYPYMCSEAGQAMIAEAIQKERLSGVVVKFQQRGHFSPLASVTPMVRPG